jgi:hypothetical protein
VTGVGAGSRAITPNYVRMRCELWFQVAERAATRQVGFGRLDQETKERMRRQALASGWDLNGAGQRVVWSKDIMRELMGRSPDDMDAMNLAYLQGMEWRDVPQSVHDEPQRREIWKHIGQERPQVRPHGVQRLVGRMPRQ